MKNTLSLNLITAALLTSFSASSFAQGNAVENSSVEDNTIEEVTVVGQSVSFANNATTQEMSKQQAAMTSALAIIDNLPGVLINEGDTFGSDDWSTTVSIRGFQLSLDEQQIGITIDGIANGNSNYGGGAKANRYIDTENLGTVQVSQGTADVASRSNEALGGTLNFTTIDPTKDAGLTLSFTNGDFEAQKYFARYQTGEVFDNTYAWVSISSSSNSDWVQQVANSERDHIAAKVLHSNGPLSVKAYASYDDVKEANYQRISTEQFAIDPTWDRLTDSITGTPYVDQVFRNGWQTLRENTFGYVQANYEARNWELSGNVYYHHNEGRGDWIPPYLEDISADGFNQPHSEITSDKSYTGGSSNGRIYFVDKAGRQLSPISGCESSITFPYGGAGAEYDPACYQAGAIPVGSYRHTHYGKDRLGFNADFSFYGKLADMDNTVRAGIWYEDYQRQEWRDWHKRIDARVSVNFDSTPYWIQYNREFNVDTTMFYIENELDFKVARVRVGAKKFLVDLEGINLFDGSKNTSIESDSETLLSAGIVAPTPIEGLELFAGYAENFAAIKDTVLERDASALDEIEPETAENIDLGLRYSSDKLNASVTYYDVTFENRLNFIAPDSPDGINYSIGNNGSFENVGGIESNGFEASATWYMTNEWGMYTSYTYNDSTYTGGLSTFPQGNTVFGSAENLAVISFDWSKGNYFAGLSTKWVGDRWMDATNTKKIDAYTVSDFYAGVAIDAPISGIKAMELRFTLNNVTDKSYLGGVANQSGWIGAPRTAAVNFKAEF
ncbi:TonB-dependent receptor [Pseudoalteromonas sp. MMG005]|uniref:TonB-dependent receptor n=1 Tax=Pseudoalteromonas sp. MMG005 TaxID=2822682 RepID=UPI001B3A6FD8|nr:TonB-dependent receptor [Pseudoalteromonas sp. MMG005]MBQ4845157.1 TonB-dependent receptor [Pseudoalteromonas sp. MMG005]